MRVYTPCRNDVFAMWIFLLPRLPVQQKQHGTLGQAGQTHLKLPAPLRNCTPTLRSPHCAAGDLHASTKKGPPAWFYSRAPTASSENASPTITYFLHRNLSIEPNQKPHHGFRQFSFCFHCRCRPAGGRRPSLWVDGRLQEGYFRQKGGPRDWCLQR
jgi:hypothetical protein